MSFSTDCNLVVPGILDSLPVTGEVRAEVFQFPSFLRTLFFWEHLREEGFHVLPGTLLDSFPEFPSFMRFRACSLDALCQVAAREDEMSWGMILSPFLRRNPITVEADGFYRLKVGVLLQVLEDLEEELFGVLEAAIKVVGILEPCSP